MAGTDTVLLNASIIAYVDGLRGPRQNPVDRDQIVKHFSKEKPEVIDRALGSLVYAGDLRVCMNSLSSGRRANGRYVYVTAGN